MELWLLILTKRKSLLRTALLESMDSKWHLRSTEMKGGRRMGLPERPLRSACFSSPRAREEWEQRTVGTTGARKGDRGEGQRVLLCPFSLDRS